MSKNGDEINIYHNRIIYNVVIESFISNLGAPLHLQFPVFSLHLLPSFLPSLDIKPCA